MVAGDLPAYPSSSPKPRILLLSAGDALRADVRRWLGDRFEVEPFSGAASALQAARAHPPALMLVDAETPHLDVEQLLRAIRDDEQLSAIPLVLLVTEEQQATTAEQLLKPFSARELLACVESQIKIGRLRREMAQALRQSEERYRAIVEGQSEMVCRFRPDGTILYINGAYARARGSTPEKLIGANLFEFIEEEDRPAVRALLERVRPEEPEIRIENRFETAGGVRWTLWANRGLVFDDNGRATELQSAGIDITDRKRAEEALRQLNETLEERVEQRTRQVRRLLSRLTMAEQEERRHVSQILHDDLQQLLYGIEMKMALIEQDLQEVDRPVLLDELHEARAWIDQAIATTRRLTVDLSPPILQNEGLAEALVWLQSQMQELHGLQVTLEAEHSFYLPDEDLRVLLFHVVRELLFNVKKHAGIERATVYLQEKDGQLLIDVVDEGQGFDPQALSSRAQQTGFGLFSIRERLKLLGGQLNVRSQPGQGTRIRARLPLPPQGSDP